MRGANDPGTHDRRPRRRRRALLYAGVVSLVAAGAVVSGLALLPDDPRKPALGVPAYAYPGTVRFWDEMVHLAPGAPLILNPATGPGERVDPTYVPIVDDLVQRGIQVLGYVDTAFGERDADEIVREARAYIAWYRVAGIFFDRTPGDAMHLALIEQAITALRGLGMSVVLNPGQPVIDRRYVDLADHVVNFEGTYASYLQAKFPGWVKSYSPHRFWHLVYEVPDTTAMARAVGLIARRHAGIAYVTDAGMPNPWNRLPTYWEDELRTVSKRIPT